MSIILVKRWKNTTKLTRRSDVTLNGVALEDVAKTIIGEIGEDRKGIVWAQVQIDARAIVLEEID